jgi:hypothetical protein
MAWIRYPQIPSRVTKKCTGRKRRSCPDFIRNMFKEKFPRGTSAVYHCRLESA